MPAYNAEKTLEATVGELSDLVDIRILVDDHSIDNTVEMARLLGLRVFVHDSNYGYGRDQQTCYREALAGEADIVVMLHPDYQYTPLLVTAMASMIAYDVYDVVLGAARLFGIRLPANLNSPLRASSIIDFWLRWHMTLTRFLTAYIYNPLVSRPPFLILRVRWH